MIVEMAGRPAEHLTAALEKHINVLNDVKDVEVHSIKVSEPREIEPNEENKLPVGESMFTAFAEADFECESFGRLKVLMGKDAEIAELKKGSKKKVAKKKTTKKKAVKKK